MSDTAAEIRDRAIAENGLLRQRVAELEAVLKLVIPASWLKDDTMDHMPGIKRARALLGKVVP